MSEREDPTAKQSEEERQFMSDSQGNITGTVSFTQVGEDEFALVDDIMEAFKAFV
jgi:hypothetical protein